MGVIVWFWGKNRPKVLPCANFVLHRAGYHGFYTPSHEELYARSRRLLPKNAWFHDVC